MQATKATAMERRRPLTAANRLWLGMEVDLLARKWIVLDLLTAIEVPNRKFLETCDILSLNRIERGSERKLLHSSV
jgi:hypothetical protein